MNSIVSFICFLLVFCLVVSFHEFGHFLMAKKNGIGVLEFSVGMGPDIVSFTRNGTKYALKWIPFGGACILQGDETGVAQEEEGLDPKKAFLNQSVWSRISVVLAGPVFNFILAFILAVMVISIAGTDRSYIQDVMDGYPTQEAGIQGGDEITDINGTSIHFYREILLYLNTHPGQTLDVTYKRDGQFYETTIVPKWNEEDQCYYMGIIGSSSYRYETTPLETLKYAVYEVRYYIVSVIESLKMLFTGGASVNDLSGPVGIAGYVNDIVDDVVEDTKDSGIGNTLLYLFLNLANFSILISANLGVMNLLPIPAIDGGKLLFMIIEVIKGSPVDRQKEAFVHLIGMALLILLMVVVMFNDIKKFFL
ncbi:MAG: RIP metalloprotease RseP [Lachnospiraceae bacterium]